MKDPHERWRMRERSWESYFRPGISASFRPGIGLAYTSDLTLYFFISSFNFDSGNSNNSRTQQYNLSSASSIPNISCSREKKERGTHESVPGSM
jgi:hypothetical protein